MKKRKSKKSVNALICKRKKFRTVFLQRWLVVMLISALAFLWGVSSLSNYEKNDWKTKFYWARECCVNSCTKARQSYEDGEQQFFNGVCFMLSYMASAYDCYSLLWDPKTGAVIESCEEKLFILMNTGEVGKHRTLVCELKNMSDWKEYRQKLEKEITPFSLFYEGLSPADIIYSDGNFFVPEEIHIDVTKTSVLEILLSNYYNQRDVFQMTIKGADSIPEGYMKEDISGYRPYYIAVGFYPTYSDMFRKKSSDDAYNLLWEYYDAIKSGEDSTFWEEKETFFTVKLVSDTEVTGINGETLSMLNVAYLDVWENYGGIFVGMGVVIFLIGTLVAFLLAKVSYAHLKAGYDMEDYRRNLMNTMAHDLKSPLMSISGYAENLRDNLHTDKQTYYSEAILRNVQYMKGIMESVLSLSKAESGKLVLKKEELEVADTLRKLLPAHEALLATQGQTVEITGECILEADKVLWEQLCNNLLENAGKYASKNSVIRVMIGEEEISFWNACDEDLRAIADTLCEPFVVGDVSRGNRNGSGLGLAIAKSICQMHGFAMELVCEEKSFEVRIKEWRVC